MFHLNSSQLSQAIYHSEIDDLERLLLTGGDSIDWEFLNMDSPLIKCVNAKCVKDLSSDQSSCQEVDAKVCEMLKLLVRRGADVNIQSRTFMPLGMTAAMFASKAGLLRCLQFLVESGANLGITTECGHTALMVASSNGQVDCVKYLTEKNRSAATLNYKNRDGHTALMVALSAVSLRDDHFLCQEYLVAASADLIEQDKYGRTALMLAAKRGKADSVKYLTEHMPRSTLDQVGVNGRTALMMAVSSSTLCLQHIILAGADLNVEDSFYGYTGLMHALKGRSGDAVDLLLEKGALVNLVTSRLETPLSVSADQPKMVHKLLCQGLDPTLSCRDQRILHVMVAGDEKRVICQLVNSGFPPVDVDCGDLIESHNRKLQREGLQPIYQQQRTPFSPLALALTFRRHDIAKYLIVSRFFTRYDLVNLCWNQKLRQALQRVPDVLRRLDADVRETGETSLSRAKKCLKSLDLLSIRQHSLRDLCLATISSALSQYLVRDSQDIPSGDSRWMCKPTFRERVELLEIPPAFKRELLHQTPSSRIPCETWGDIPLGEEM